MITGLKYLPAHQELQTEQQLLDVFEDLREQHSRLNHSFSMVTPTGEPIQNFEQFLKYAIKEDSAIILEGSGNIGGIVVQEASLEYDLSPMGELVRYWDIRRDGSCHSCHQIGREQIFHDESRYYCTEGVDPMKWKGCDKYDARIKNAEGGPARKLSELVEEATLQEA